jgi:hypothetical protein
MIEITIYSLFSDPNAFIIFLICFLIAIFMQLASKSKNNETSSNPKNKKASFNKGSDPLIDFQNGDFIHTILGMMQIKNKKIKLRDINPEILSYEAELILPNNEIINYLTFSRNNRGYNPTSSPELSKFKLKFNIDDFYNFILSTNDSNDLTKKYNRQQMILPRTKPDTIEEVKKIFNIFTDSFKDYYIQDSLLNIEDLFSKNTLNSIYKYQKGNYNQKNDEIKGDYNINSWSNPLLKSSRFHFSYFHNNGSEIFYIFKVYVEKYAFKTIRLPNFPGDNISENYVAIFDKIPDFSFYLNTFGGSFVTFDKGSLGDYNKLNQYFFRLAYRNHHLNLLLLDKQTNFQDISGFSYNKISLKKFLIQNELSEIVPNGLFPNDLFKDYYKIQFNKLDSLVKKIFNGSMSTNYFIFYSLLDLANPYFNDTMLPRSYQNYNGGLFKELVLIAQEKKYLNAKWKSEFNLYLFFKKLFDDTIYQYRDSWLGLQSIDIYVPSLKIGIEYQGKQHYEAISFFGGKESFKKNKSRDLKKSELCKINGIKLIEWKYTNEVTDYEFNRFISKHGIKISKSRTKYD